jgi:dTMP kinase
MLGRNGMVLAESTLRWLAIARALVRSACGGRIAVMDRYAVCQYASTRAHRASRWEPVARLLYRIFPAPDLTILLAVDPAEAYRRIELRGTDQESRAFLAAADAAYRSLPEFPGFVVVDANGTPDEVSRAIAGQLRGWLPPEQSTAARSGEAGPTRSAEPGVSRPEEPAADDSRPEEPPAHRHRSGHPVPIPA